MKEIKGKYTTAKIMTDDVEQSCYEQVLSMTNKVNFDKPIVCMPDCHSGKGSVIGFTAELGTKLDPCVVGVDIACGVISMNLGKMDNLDFKNIDDKIRSVVPTGTSINSDDTNFKKYMNFKTITNNIRTYIDISLPEYTKADFDKMLDKFGNKYDKSRIYLSINSLGGGNHYIELGKSSNDDVWLTVHTGSRNLGQQICKFHENVAKTTYKNIRDNEFKNSNQKIIKNCKKEDIERLLKSNKEKFGRNDSRNAETYYLETEYLDEYLKDMIVAQEYARANRQAIINNICKVLKFRKQYFIESIHNYIDFEDNIIRKGAIRAHKNERCLIALNSKEGMLICRGKSNKDWNLSAAHGCGRNMSRTASKELITQTDAEEAMEGVYSSVLPRDESPLAYKDSKEVIKNLNETVEILDTIVPILNIKSK